MSMANNPDYRKLIPVASAFFSLVFCLLMAGLVVADEAAESPPTAEYSGGANRCMSCHREGREQAAHEIFMTKMGISNHPDSPFAEGSNDCETCHGPSAAHRKKNKDGTRPSPSINFDETTPVDVQNGVCEGCHKGDPLFHWPGSMHEEEELACSNCHKVHVARDPVFDPVTQQEVCFTCHARTRSDIYKASSHPLRFGQMTCSDCHNAHDGSNDYLLSHATVNDTCYTCHAEKRGPFLWEHAPASEDCSLCHNAHGSNHADLLKQRAPLLCQQCHSPSGHPSTAYTTEVAENSFQQRFLLARSCTNCHAQVHGSNHPSGVTITR